MHLIREVARGLKARLRTIVSSLRQWWDAHRQRLSEEMGYADAFAALLIAAADLFGHSYRIRYAVRELVRAYIALQRIFFPPDPGGTGGIPRADY